jgi:hypothetical protein
MALVVDAVTYSLVINSNDRISGTHNNASYQVNWKDFLPDDYQSYKIAFSFQSGGGFYADGIYSNSGPGVGATATIVSTVVAAVGSTIITLPNYTNVAIGMTVISATGISSGTTVTAMSGTTPFTVTLSSPTLVTLPVGTSFSFYLAANVNQATFSSARVLFMNQGRSFSFDTSNKGPSVNIGILQRDIQVATSKSNSLSCFYCQSPPRSIDRPNQNLLTINIMNNYSFIGGITSYTTTSTGTGANTVITYTPNYSSVATNQNFLTDSNATGSIIQNDMSAYTMLIEFIPISDSKIAKRNASL